MTRTITLILLDFHGEIVGRSASFEVGSPWWQEVGDVARAFEQRYGPAVDVLRLLSTERARPHGGAITYLVQARTPVHLDLDPVDPELVDLLEQDEPRRAPYARPGGPAASLAWAAELVGPVTAVQLRSWNLSAIWRLDAERDTYWLKQLPSWLSSEPAALHWLGEVVPDLAPVVIAQGDQGRELLADVPGIDHYGADQPTRLRIVEQAHRFQTAALADTDRLLADGVPDRRGPHLTAWIRASLKGGADASPAAGLLAGLDERMAAVAECGLPDTLVHGDAHPGNTRGDSARLVFLDWSDCFLGHPAFDALGLVDDLSPAEAEVILGAWAAGWRRQVPGCDPGRALDLLRPVSALRSAAVYAEFVANVEPAEQRYHSFDVADSLRVAADE